MAQPAQPPAMPPVPPLGQADGAAVWGAFGAFKARQHHGMVVARRETGGRSTRSTANSPAFSTAAGGLTASQSGDDLVTLIRTAEAGQWGRRGVRAVVHGGNRLAGWGQGCRC